MLLNKSVTSQLAVVSAAAFLACCKLPPKPTEDAIFQDDEPFGAEIEFVVSQPPEEPNSQGTKPNLDRKVLSRDELADHLTATWIWPTEAEAQAFREELNDLDKLWDAINQMLNCLDRVNISKEECTSEYLSHPYVQAAVTSNHSFALLINENLENNGFDFPRLMQYLQEFGFDCDPRKPFIGKNAIAFDEYTNACKEIKFLFFTPGVPKTSIDIVRTIKKQKDEISMSLEVLPMGLYTEKDLAFDLHELGFLDVKPKGPIVPDFLLGYLNVASKHSFRQIEAEYPRFKTLGIRELPGIQDAFRAPPFGSLPFTIDQVAEFKEMLVERGHFDVNDGPLEFYSACLYEILSVQESNDNSEKAQLKQIFEGVVPEDSESRIRQLYVNLREGRAGHYAQREKQVTEWISKARTLHGYTDITPDIAGLQTLINWAYTKIGKEPPLEVNGIFCGPTEAELFKVSDRIAITIKGAKHAYVSREQRINTLFAHQSDILLVDAH